MAENIPAGKGRRKTVDKWKKKEWFTILSSKTFDKKPLGETPAEKPLQLIGRTIKSNLGNITGQRTKRDIVVSFKYSDVQGKNISTNVSKFEVSKSTLARLVRRRNSKVDLVKRIKVANGDAKIAIIIVTYKEATQKQRAGLRDIISKEIETLTGKDFEAIVNELLFGKLTTEISKKSAKICIVKKVIVSKATYTEAK